MLSARSSAVRARLGDDPSVSIDYIEASGDCFYMAVEAALSESDGWHPVYGVGRQRELVAAALTEETFQCYAMLHSQGCDGARARAAPAAHAPLARLSRAGRRRAGFQFMKDVSDLADLRRRVQLRGQKVGAHKCVWADGFAMETIANYFQVRARARPLAPLQRPRGRSVPIMH